jgi:hypothetical protein
MSRALNWSKDRSRSLAASNRAAADYGSPPQHVLDDLAFMKPRKLSRRQQKPSQRRPVGPLTTFQAWWHLRDKRCVHWNDLVADPALCDQLVHRKNFEEQRRLLAAGKMRMGPI